jgi:hypothetical protein
MKSPPSEALLERYRSIVTVLQGKCVADRPPEFRDRLMAAGFSEDVEVLSIPDLLDYCFPSIRRPGHAYQSRSSATIFGSRSS